MLDQATNQIRGGLVIGFAVLSFLGVTGSVWAFQASGGDGAGTLATSAGPVTKSSLPSAYGLSMVFQILFPWLAGLVVTGIAAVRKTPAERWVREIVGYASWKAGCDFGFYLVQGPSVWQAFHPAGLAAYSVVYFLCFYVFGVVIIGETLLKLLRNDRPPSPRMKWLQPLLSRWCYESGDARNSHTPLSHVLIKPFLILFAATCSWPMYDVGLNIAERSDSSVMSVYANYNYYLLWMFTLGGYFGRIVFFNCGWLLYHVWKRSSATRPDGDAVGQPTTTLTATRLKAVTDWFASLGVTREFLVERIVGVVGVAWLLPLLAARMPAYDQLEVIPIPFSPKQPGESLASPNPDESLPIATPHRHELPQDGITFELDRIIDGPETGKIKLKIGGPGDIYYATQGDIPALEGGQPVKSTRRHTPGGDGLLFDQATILRAGYERDGRLAGLRSVAILPNRWEARLPGAPIRAKAIADVYVTGDFRNWSERPEPQYRLLPRSDGSYSREILIDGSLRTNYKFLLHYRDEKPEWFHSDDLPQVFDGAYMNNVVCHATRLQGQFRAARDGLLEEACLRWEQVQLNDSQVRVALILPAGDVESVELKFPGKGGVPASATPQEEFGMKLTSYHNIVSACAPGKPTGYCFHVRDLDQHWLVGPRGAVPCAADDATQDLVMARMARAGNLFESQPCLDSLRGRDYRSRVIYFAIVDRFVDGDSSNNAGENAALYDPDGTNLNYYQGGDIRGLIQELPYLSDLGAGGLWITPLVPNLQEVDRQYAPHKTSYHGYWGVDFFEVDKRFGNWDDFKELGGRLKTSNMELMLDFVPNHASPHYLPLGGKLLKQGAVVVESHAADAKLSPDQQFYRHVGGMNCEEEKDRWPDRHLRDSFGLSDFNHDNPAVTKYLLDAARLWLKQGATSLRLDSLKHADPDFVRMFCKQLNDEGLSDPNESHPVFIVGEWFGGGVHNRASLDFVNQTDYCELLDFSLRDRLLDFMRGGKCDQLNPFLARRHDAFRGRDTWQVTFLDNHDTKRAFVELHDSTYGGGLGAALVKKRMDQGMTLLLTLPGIPVVYYGTEIYLADETPVWVGSNVKIGDEPYNRPMMPKDFHERARTPGETMAPLIKALSQLRQESLAVQRAPHEPVWSDRNGLAFQRAFQPLDSQGDVVVTPTDVVFVAVNQGAARDIDVTNLKLPDGDYWNRLPAPAVCVQVRGGAARLPLPAEGALVLHTPLPGEKSGGGERAKSSAK